MGEALVENGWFATSDHAVYAIINGRPYEIDAEDTPLASLPPGSYATDEEASEAAAQETKAFDEAKHPRDEGGKFTSSGGESSGASATSISRPQPKITVGAKASAGAGDRVKAAVAAIPAKHAEALKDVAVTLRHSSRDYSIASHRRGRPAGFYSPAYVSSSTDEKVDPFIEITETLPLRERGIGGMKTFYLPLKQVEKTTVHELGHAFDYHHEGKLREAIDKDVDEAAQALTVKQKKDGAYWLKDPAEKFAALYALAYNPVDNEHQRYFGGLSRQDAERVFAKPLAKIKAL